MFYVLAEHIRASQRFISPCATLVRILTNFFSPWWSWTYRLPHGPPTTSRNSLHRRNEIPLRPEQFRSYSSPSSVEKDAATRPSLITPSMKPTYRKTKLCPRTWSFKPGHSILQTPFQHDDVPQNPSTSRPPSLPVMKLAKPNSALAEPPRILTLPSPDTPWFKKTLRGAFQIFVRFILLP